jgi:hypothetical protein
MGRMAFHRLLIFIIFLNIVLNNTELFSQVNNEITKKNNNLYIGTTNIIELDEDDKVFTKEFEQYIIIQIKPNVHKSANTIIYNKNTNQFLLLNAVLSERIYYWEGYFVYRHNSKIGKWALLSLNHGTEILIGHWISTLYLVNNELCIVSSNGFLSIINNNRYNKDAHNIEILPIDFDDSIRVTATKFEEERQHNEVN